MMERHDDHERNDANLSVKVTNASLDTARSVLLREAQALHKLAEKLQQNDQAMRFAIELVLGRSSTLASGKIVTVGVGKSGFVAQKLAATLTALGTQAVFLHPIEALHGDIGILQAECDTVLALSYSGESLEVLALMQLPQVQRCAKIVMTANEHAQLVRLADAWLDCGCHDPMLKGTDAVLQGGFHTSSIEGWPEIPVPTTSAISMMALGDAFCVALSHAKGVQRQTFHANHPGGNLGKVLLNMQ